MVNLPILFSAPMVRAILREIEQPGTGKTQTRRVLDVPPMTFDAVFNDDGVWHIGDALTGHRYAKLAVRYRIGDRLYVREAWRCHYTLNETAPRDLPPENSLVSYVADGDSAIHIRSAGRLRQGMHMPRWASRLTLIVTDVSVQRLQEISEADAIAEGVINTGRREGAPYDHFAIPGCAEAGMEHDPVPVFGNLWEFINGEGSWNANPWIAAYTFRLTLGNIDQVRP